MPKDRDPELWRYELGPYGLITVTVHDGMFVASMYTGISSEGRESAGFSNGNGASAYGWTAEELCLLATRCLAVFRECAASATYVMLHRLAQAADDIYNRTVVTRENQ